MFSFSSSPIVFTSLVIDRGYSLVILILMKVFLRHILINLGALYLVDQIYPGFTIQTGISIFLTAAVVWFFLNKIVKPIIKLLLLPINLITMGFFSWAVSVLTLFLLKTVVVGVSISSYDFPGFSSQGFSIPSFYINLFFSYLVISILLNLVQSSINWLIKE